MQLLFFFLIEKAFIFLCKARERDSTLNINWLLSGTINYLVYFSALTFYKETDHERSYCRFISKNNFGFIFLASIKSVSSFLFSGYLGYMMRIDFLSDSLRTCRSLTYQRKIQLCSYIVLTKEESKRIYFTKDSSRKAAITFSYLD